MKKKGLDNARKHYVQSVLSGFSGNVQPENKNDDSEKSNVKQYNSPFFWQQKSYVLYVPVVITETNVSDTEYTYKVSVPTNLELSLSPYKPKSKSLSGQAFSMAKETDRDTSGIYLVYGIPEAGSNSLPPASINPIRESVPYLFSRLLGQAHRAIEHIIQFSGKGQKLQEGTKNPGLSKEVSPTPKDLGANKKRGRGGKIRKQIRLEGQAESSPILDDTNGKILGERPGDGTDRLVGMGVVPLEGTALEGGTLEF